MTTMIRGLAGAVLTLSALGALSGCDQGASQVQTPPAPAATAPGAAKTDAPAVKETPVPNEGSSSSSGVPDSTKK